MYIFYLYTLYIPLVCKLSLADRCHCEHFYYVILSQLSIIYAPCPRF